MRTNYTLTLLVSLFTASAASALAAEALPEELTERKVAQADSPGGAVSTEATAAAPAPHSPFNPSSGARGTRGIHRVEGGHRLPAGELVLTLGGSYFTATGFLCNGTLDPTSGCLSTGDTNDRQRQVLSIVWALPWVHGLELFINQSSTTNTNNAFAQRTTQILGDPEIAVKYTYEIGDWIGAGALVAVMFPTSVRGTGLKPEAMRFTLLGAGSFAFTDWMELSANLGFIYDNTGQLFCSNGVCRAIDRAQQFSAGIPSPEIGGWMIPLGVGVATNFNLFDIIGLGPFAELSMGFGDVAIDQDPMMFSGGLKVYPANRGLLELTMGADVRILGAPRSGAGPGLPGVAPWEIFGRVSAHLFAVEKEAPAAAVAATGVCSVDADCGSGQTCLEGICGIVKEVVKTEQVFKAPPAWRLEGKVVDKDSKEPVPGAVIIVSGTPYSNLAADDATGEFKSFPLDTGDGIIKVQVVADGFLPGETTMPRGAGGEVKQITLELQKVTENMTGELKGSIKDARTGQPIAAQVFIPKLGQKIDVDAAGSFLSTLKSGRFQVLVSSKGYITQKKEIDIRPGDVVILNIDLAPKKR